MIRAALATLVVLVVLFFVGSRIGAFDWAQEAWQNRAFPAQQEPTNPRNNAGADNQAPADSACRSQQWVNEVLAAGGDVSAVLGQLDRDYSMNDSATWSQPGYTVPANTIVWTDWLPENGIPAQVRAIRVQGTWGAWYAVSAFNIPAPNGGGRFTQLCSGVTVGASASEDPYQTGNSSGQGAVPQDSSICLTVEQAEAIQASTDQVNAYNAYFEETGFAFGATLSPGQSIPAAAFFLGSQPTPVASSLQMGDSLWVTSQGSVAPDGGRFMSFCEVNSQSSPAEDATPPAASPPASDAP